MSIRKTSVAGSFYPAASNEIDRYLDHFNSLLNNANFNTKSNFTPKAIISPHAGYVYSGFTANAAFRVIQNLNPKRVVVIGPSHRVFIEGASVALYDEYETPYGNIEIDSDLNDELLSKFDFLSFKESAHGEHSTETQMPFIKHYFPNSKVVEIVYGKIEYWDITDVIEEVLNDPDNFVIISTDLSHFYTQAKAEALDNICLSGIDHLDLKRFDEGCEACGITGIKAVVKYAKEHNLQSKIIDYRTSFDASGDDSRVVGYVSALIG